MFVVFLDLDEHSREYKGLRKSENIFGIKTYVPDYTYKEPTTFEV